MVPEAVPRQRGPGDVAPAPRYRARPKEILREPIHPRPRPRPVARRLPGLLAIAALLLAAGPARAGYNASYTATLDQGVPDVTNILMLEQWSGGGATTWAFSAAGDGDTTTITNPFPTDTPTLSSLLIGLSQDPDGPDGSPGQLHVVLMMDNTAASLVDHIAWGTVFQNTDEDQLIAAIQLATSGQDFSIITPGLDAIGAFASGDATNILGPGGVTYSAWFATGGPFTVVSFSDGNIIGTGTSADIFTAPEPSSVALLGLGAGGLLGHRRHRRRHAAA